MRRTIMVYAVVLLTALTASYLSWTSKKDPTLEDAVVLVQAEREDLEEILYESENLTLSMKLMEDDFGEYAWVEATRISEKKVPPPRPDPPTPRGPGGKASPHGMPPRPGAMPGKAASPHGPPPGAMPGKVTKGAGKASAAEAKRGKPTAEGKRPKGSKGKDAQDDDTKKNIKVSTPKREAKAGDAKADAKEAKADAKGAKADAKEAKADAKEEAPMSSEPPAETEGAEPEPEPEPEVVREEKHVSFKAGASGDKLIEKLTPLVAKRELEGVTEEQLADIGLEEPGAKVTIKRKGREPRVFELGGDVFGGANAYVRDLDDGKIYIVDAKVFRPLKNGDRTLKERELFHVKEKDAVKVKVTSPAGSAEFEQRNRDDRKAAYWGRVGEEAADDTAKEWIRKVFSRVRLSDYVLTEEQPATPETVYSMQVEGAEGKSVTVEILKGEDAEGEEQWYARSEHTRGLVKLNRTIASETAADLDAVLNPEDA